MQFELVLRGPYSLAASAAFLEGFGPAAHPKADDPRHLHLAFVADGGGAAAGVCLQERDGSVVGEAYGDAPLEAVRTQVERIVSLDADGAGFPAVGVADPVVGRLQTRYPGLRPVLFFSPYEAAAWALISHRLRIVQAARVKAGLTADLGLPVSIHGEPWHAFPPPVRLARA